MNNEKIIAELEKNPDFIDYYCRMEDKWLQNADWEKKLIAVFGSISNAKFAFLKETMDKEST